MSIQIDKFRPPYGRLTRLQANSILQDQEIIMWSVLSKDYDQSLQANICLKNTIHTSKNGSIVLFHDSLKAENTLKKILPTYLNYFTDKGFTFSAL